MGNVAVINNKEHQLILAAIPADQRRLLPIFISSKKVKNYSPEEHMALHLTLKQIAKASGIKIANLQSTNLEEDHTVIKPIHLFIKDQFSNLSKEEIEKAFDMAFSGRFGNNLDVSCYGEFSKVFVGRILGHYVATLNKELIKFNQESERLKKAKDSVLSEAETNKIIAQSIVENFDNYKKDKSNFVDIKNIQYNFLDKMGLIPFTPKQKWDYVEQAKKNILANCDKPKHDLKISDIIFTAVDDEGMKNQKIVTEAKRISLMAFFDELVRNETNVKSMLSKYLK